MEEMEEMLDQRNKQLKKVSRMLIDVHDIAKDLVVEV